jgi:WD40 repeat protein
MSQDGRLLVSGGADKVARFWNPAQLVKLTDPKLPIDPAKAGDRAGAAGEILLTTVRNDGNMIATGEADGRIRLYSPFIDGPQGEGFQHPGGIAGLAFHSNNQQVVSAGKDGFVRVWNLQAQPPKDIPIGDKPLLDIVLYNGGAQVITGGADGRVLMTDTNSGQLVRAFVGLTGEARAVASRSDNQRIAAGSSEGKVLIWNAGEGALLQTLEVPGAVVSLTFSPDNQKLAVTTKDKALVFFGPPLPPQSPQPGSEFVLHQQATAESVLTRIHFDRENKSLWASDEGGHINQWAYASPVQVRQFNHGGAVYAVAVSGDGKTVVSCSTDQTVRIWDVPTGQQRAQMNGHQGAVHALALSPDESFVVSSGADKTIRLWDVAGGRQLKQLATFDETMYAVAIHPNGNTIALGGADRKVHLINVVTGVIERTLEGHSDYVHSVAFNPQGTRLLSYGYAGELKVWNPVDGQVLHQERIGRIGNFAHYASDGTRVLLSNGDGTARVYPLPAQAQ